jgi:hypothetical protein
VADKFVKGCYPQKGWTMSAVREMDRPDGMIPITANSLSELVQEIRRLRGLLAEINTTARIPTPQGMRAYTHFQRDFDKIRALSAVERDLTKMEAGG